MFKKEKSVHIYVETWNSMLFVADRNKLYVGAHQINFLLSQYKSYLNLPYLNFFGWNEYTVKIVVII
jgi:hypothetical protein